MTEVMADVFGYSLSKLFLGTVLFLWAGILLYRLAGYDSFDDILENMKFQIGAYIVVLSVFVLYIGMESAYTEKYSIPQGNVEQESRLAELDSSPPSEIIKETKRDYSKALQENRASNREAIRSFDSLPDKE